MDISKNIVDVSGGCYDYIEVSSNGLWNETQGESILQHGLVRLHIQLFVMFLLINCFHFVLRRFHFSRFTSEFLAGVVLGPTLIGKYFGSASYLLFPEVDVVIYSISKICFILFIFFAGVRLDPSLIFKTGKTAFILGIVLCLSGFIMAQNVTYEFPKDSNLPDGSKILKGFVSNIFFSTIVQTRFVSVSSMLMQLKIVNSQLGHLAMASSLISELIRQVYGTFLGFARAPLSASTPVAVQLIILSLTFLIFIITILRKMMFTFIRRTPQGTPMKQIYTSIIMALVFLLAAGGEFVGMSFVVGPIIFGLAVPAMSPLAEILITKFDTVISGFLLPLMSTFCASKIDLWSFVEQFDLALSFKISIIGFIIRVALTFATTKFCGIPWGHCAALTIILNAKGYYEVGQFLSIGELEEMETITGFVLIFLIQAFQPMLVKKLYDPTEHYVGYKKNSITDASDDVELRILVCAHRQGDALAAMNLLECSNPTKQSPLYIFGLCLEELISSFTPLLINHQLGQKITSSEGTRSQPIIDIFRYFELQTMKLAHVNVFTAVSPVKQMHQDICWLAFEKACSLIVLPFHKKWNRRGNVVSSNAELRNLNINVLERAPCSVGILIDRQRNCDLSSIFVTSTTYRVAILFLGGADDREAVAYALRMARSPKVHLTITRFISQNDQSQHLWDSVRDNEFLRKMGVKSSDRTNINYVEEIVRDGSDTSAIIQSMLGDHDLIMVGRRHETKSEALSGLSEWSELPELGLIGDLFASEHISSPISILVVQQQILKASHSSTLI